LFSALRRAPPDFVLKKVRSSEITPGYDVSSLFSKVLSFMIIHSIRKALTGGKPAPKALLVKKIDNTI
jgi:hypothetical protein